MKMRLITNAAYTLLGITALLLLFLGLSLRGAATVPVDGRTAVELPIIMYHSVLKEPSRHGAYVVSPETVREDLVYLKNKGYTTVFLSEVVDYVYSGAPLPDKPVLITFDDGHMNNLEYILPLLSELDMKAVVSVVGEFTDIYTASGDRNAAYSYLFWDDIAVLSASGRFEIQNHSYMLHHNDGARGGASRRRFESREEYAEMLEADVMKLQSRLAEVCDTAPIAFTYPYGLISDCSDEILRELGFLATLSCFERINIISDESSLYSLGRFNRPSGISTEAFMARLLPQ